MPALRYTWLALALTLAFPVHAADWPQWRGPSFNGSTDEKNLPSAWSKTENIAWSADLPGAAAATPIVGDRHVFLSGVDATAKTLQAMGFDRATGKLLWRHDVAQGIQKDHRSNYASNSPVTDGKQVIFFYGTGDLIAYDLDGARRWARNIQKDYGPFAFMWTFSSTPLLFEGTLYVQVLQRDVPIQGRGFKDRKNESYILALNPQTGETRWRHARPSQAVAESRESHTTPIPFLHDRQKLLLIAGGDAITGHDPADGKELWRWGSYNASRATMWPLIASPVAGDGVALVCVPKRQPVYAVRLGGSGDLDDRAVAWASREAKDVTSEVPSPAYYDGDFFVLSDSRPSLSRVAPRDGKVKWTVPTPGQAKYEASPLAADGRVFLINFDGQVAIFRADNGELLRTIPMDEPAGGEVVRASIAAAHGQLYIRTTRKLYCVGAATR
jgi:outer membrane protein assembly factor BamB